MEPQITSSRYKRKHIVKGFTYDLKYGIGWVLVIMVEPWCQSHRQVDLINYQMTIPCHKKETNVLNIAINIIHPQ